MIFVSKREIRLWAVACLLIFTIYSTLPIVGDILQVIQYSGWGLGLFVLVCCTTLLFVVTEGFTSTPGLKETIVTIVTAIVYLLVLSEIDQPEERIHVVMYGIVALVIHAAFLERSTHGHGVPLSYMAVIGVTAIIGTIDEIIQLGLPNRVFDVHDIWYDVLAAVLSVAFNISLRWARRP